MKIIQLHTGKVLWEDAARANLYDANLIVGGHRSDGYRFMLIKEPDNSVKVSAGCRYFTVADGRAHWSNKPGILGKESLILLDSLVSLAELAGWSTQLEQ